mmetsp:Transcript_39924/g.89487  ORF Transcript_39924/g.89487 Transcript_39924/m.89487 type:complete len:388 (+) Transcript_39924:782-1945(+)
MAASCDRAAKGALWRLWHRPRVAAALAAMGGRPVVPDSGWLRNRRPASTRAVCRGRCCGDARPVPEWAMLRMRAGEVAGRFSPAAGLGISRGSKPHGRPVLRPGRGARLGVCGQSSTERSTRATPSEDLRKGSLGAGALPTPTSRCFTGKGVRPSSLAPPRRRRRDWPSSGPVGRSNRRLSKPETSPNVDPPSALTPPPPNCGQAACWPPVVGSLSTASAGESSGGSAWAAASTGSKAGVSGSGSGGSGTASSAAWGSAAWGAVGGSTGDSTGWVGPEAAGSGPGTALEALSNTWPLWGGSPKRISSPGSKSCSWAIAPSRVLRRMSGPPRTSRLRSNSSCATFPSGKASSPPPRPACSSKSTSPGSRKSPGPTSLTTCPLGASFTL